MIPGVPEEWEVLIDFCEVTDGTNWAQNENWLSEASIASCYSVAPGRKWTRAGVDTHQ